MSRTCGKCLHWLRIDASQVGWCHGAPPTVTAVTPGADGQINVTSHHPLRVAESAPCGMHRHRSWWRRLLAGD